MSNMASLESKLYCKTHFMELFASNGGSYEALTDKSRFKHNAKGYNEAYGTAAAADVTINSSAAAASSAGRALHSPLASTASKKGFKADDEASIKRESMSRDKKRESLDNDRDIIASRSTSIKDRMKQYQDKAGASSSPSSPTSRSPSSSFSEPVAMKVVSMETGKSVGTDETPPSSPRARVKSSRLQSLMNNYNAAASSGSGNEQEEEEEVELLGSDEREEAKAEPAQAQDEEPTDDEEEAEESAEVAADMPSSLEDAQAIIAGLREALSASQAEAEASKAELSAAVKKHEYEAAIEFAKRMEADEWCAKTSKDMETLKTQLANKSSDEGSEGGTSDDDRLARRASGSLEPMAEIAESADESEDE